MSIYSFHHQTLLVLREVKEMLKEIDVDYRMIAQRAVDGMLEDLKKVEKQQDDLTKLLDGAVRNANIGELSPAEIEELEKDDE